MIIEPSGMTERSPKAGVTLPPKAVFSVATLVTEPTTKPALVIVVLAAAGVVPGCYRRLAIAP